MARRSDNGGACDRRANYVADNEFCEVTIEMSADQLASMIGQLVASEPKAEKRTLSARSAFGTVVKNFSPGTQEYLLGETPDAYWIRPEVSASIAFFHRQNKNEPENRLPGEVVRKTRKKRSSRKDSSKELENQSSVVFCRVPVSESKSYTLSETEPYDAPDLSPIEQRLADSGFRYDDQELNRLLIRAASQHSNVPVILVGNVGVGKTHLARILHDCHWEGQGQKKEHPWIEVNCAQLDSNLANSILFGHVKGAFTGSVADRKGCFALANNGTLFLDEFEELPLAMQAKLLGTIDPGEPLVHRFTPLGGDSTQESNFRLILATNVEPKILLQKGLLRHDFFSRLGLHVVRLPLLAHNPKAIAPLFWKIFESVKSRNKTGTEEELRLDPVAKSDLESWLGSGKGKWVNNRRDLVHAANELYMLGIDNQWIIDRGCVDLLLKAMEHYWQNEVETNNLVFERDGENLKIRVDYTSLFEVCCGPNFVEKLDARRYSECFWLIWANLIGGSARAAGMIYFKGLKNPSEKMKKTLLECGLLEDKNKYDEMLHSMQTKFLNALTDDDKKKSFADLFKDNH